MDIEEKLEKPFHVDRAKSGRAGCKKCKQKIESGELRLGKLGYNPFSSGTMKYWHHVPCMFEVFKKQRKTTKKIDSFAEVEGWDSLSEEDKNNIKSYFAPEELKEIEANTLNEESTKPLQTDNKELSENKDNSFRAFRKICSELTQASSYLTKTSIVKEFFEKGSDGTGFKGDMHLWCRSLLPMAAKRVYNLQSKQLVKIFSDIFRTSQEEMLEDLEQGDVAETISQFLQKSKKVDVAKKAVLTLNEVDSFLEYLSKLTREADQIDHFKSILPKCTANDLKSIIRLIKHDLRINAGPKHILEALDPKAYPAFQASRDLKVVVDNVFKCKDKGKGGQGLKVGISIMTPVLPMLAEACSSVEMAFRKCPDGMYSEIKYDGERVQLHKQGDTFKYFSRSLKPVLNHKVSHFEKYIPEAFPHGKDLILDSEILMVDTETGNPLPFGTLGIHKKHEFQHATVCLFVFDCIYYNGESLIDKPIKERRRVLKENMKEITHHVMFSAVQEIHQKEDLENMMETVFRKGLEGLVIKPLNSRYEPGKRHWLKVKKDYLAGGTMADTADLVVLGAWFGTGKKGGIMSVFLMGCYDENRKKWVTVTKVHGGHDDKTLEGLQTELQMEKISKDASRVPSWLLCAKTMVPDFVSKDPKMSPVWEITGAEFTCNQVHTAGGISIRFPRVTRIRNDKNWETATSLSELKKIYEASKDTSGFTLKGKSDEAAISETPKESLKKDKKTEKDKPKDSEYKERKKAESEKRKDEKVGKEKDHKKRDDKSKESDKNKRKKDDDNNHSSKKQRKSVSYDDETDEDEDKSNKKEKRDDKWQDKSSKKRKKEKEEDSRRSKKQKNMIDYDDETEDDDNGNKKEKKEKNNIGYDDETDEDNDSSNRKEKEKRDDRSKDKNSKKRKKEEDSRSSKKHKNMINYDDDTEDDDDKNNRTERKIDTKNSKQSTNNMGYDDDTDEDEDSNKNEKKQRGDTKDTENKKENQDEINRKASKREQNMISCFGESDGEDVQIKKTNKNDLSIKRDSYNDEKSKSPQQKTNSGSDTEVEEDPVPNAKLKISMKNKLPDLFTGFVVHLNKSVSDKDMLRRFVIAYDGNIFNENYCSSLENEKQKITHYVYPSRNVRNKTEIKGREIEMTKHVVVDWLWDSIKKGKCLPETDFKIKTN